MEYTCSVISCYRAEHCRHRTAVNIDHKPQTRTAAETTWNE